MPEIETLKTEGFLFESVDLSLALLTADFGDGYSAASLIGSPEGLRAWTMKIDVVPDGFEHVGAVEGTLESRAAYLWNFFKRSKVAGNQPFWFAHSDPGDVEKLWLAEFVDHKLSYGILCAQIYTTGLQIRQRRLRDQESPIAIIIVLPEYGEGEYGG